MVGNHVYWSNFQMLHTTANISFSSCAYLVSVSVSDLLTKTSGCPSGSRAAPKPVWLALHWILNSLSRHRTGAPALRSRVVSSLRMRLLVSSTSSKARPSWSNVGLAPSRRSHHGSCSVSGTYYDCV